MALSTRRPTGKPSWPALLIAGGEKTGKSWSCALASASPKIGRTLWVSIGETDPDEYAQIQIQQPDGSTRYADFEIVEHDGTVRGVIEVLREIAALPATNPPTLLVVDSMTKLWDMISDNLQETANKRAKNPGMVDMTLWNKGKKEHARAVRAILAHKGPAILTARLEAVTVMDDRGRPTPLKADKIKTEKGLPYDVDGVVQMPERGVAIISGLRSVRVQLQEPTRFPDFTVDGLWDKLGLAGQETAPRTVSDPAPAQAVEDPLEGPENGSQGFGIGAALGTRATPKAQPVTEATLTRVRQGLHALGEGPDYVEKHTEARDVERISEAVAQELLDHINADWTARQK